MKELYYLVHWPDSQELMEIEGIYEHSSLYLDESSAYFVDKDWYDENVELNYINQ